MDDHDNKDAKVNNALDRERPDGAQPDVPDYGNNSDVATVAASRSPSLDINGTDSTSVTTNTSTSLVNIVDATPKRSHWTRQQKKIFHRVKSLLTHWEACGYGILWVALTTATGGDAANLAYHHKMLRNRIERKLGFTGIEFLHVETREGNGVLHVIWAWKPPKGSSPNAFYVEHSWLSQQWEEIHGAPIVYVKRYRTGANSQRHISRYLVSQYVSNQVALVRVSWSRLRSLGFSLIKIWYQFKGIWKHYYARHVPYRDFLAAWESLLVKRCCRLLEDQYFILDGQLQKL